MIHPRPTAVATDRVWFGRIVFVGFKRTHLTRDLMEYRLQTISWMQTGQCVGDLLIHAGRQLVVILWTAALTPCCILALASFILNTILLLRNSCRPTKISVAENANCKVCTVLEKAQDRPSTASSEVGVQSRSADTDQSLSFDAGQEQAERNSNRCEIILLQGSRGSANFPGQRVSERGDSGIRIRHRRLTFP